LISCSQLSQVKVEGINRSRGLLKKYLSQQLLKI